MGHWKGVTRVCVRQHFSRPDDELDVLDGPGHGISVNAVGH